MFEHYILNSLLNKKDTLNIKYSIEFNTNSENDSTIIIILVIFLKSKR